MKEIIKIVLSHLPIACANYRGLVMRNYEFAVPHMPYQEPSQNIKFEPGTAGLRSVLTNNERYATISNLLDLSILLT